VWCGVDERRSLGRGVSGAIVAIPVWVPMMIAAHRGMKVVDFERPEGIKSITLCKESHLTAVRQCPKVDYEFFYDSTLVDTCDIHGPGRYRKDSNMNIFGTPIRKEIPDKKKRPLMF
jgi:membrane carboxypeptidase/penicillin-binding protein